MPPEPPVRFEVISARAGRPGSLPAPTPTPTPVPTPGPGLMSCFSCTATGAPRSSANWSFIASRPTPAACGARLRSRPAACWAAGRRASGTGASLLRSRAGCRPRVGLRRQRLLRDVRLGHPLRFGGLGRRLERRARARAPAWPGAAAAPAAPRGPPSAAASARRPRRRSGRCRRCASGCAGSALRPRARSPTAAPAVRKETLRTRWAPRRCVLEVERAPSERRRRRSRHRLGTANDTLA